jgi:drug/metabolite transporter (DMT)-like permease
LTPDAHAAGTSLLEQSGQPPSIGDLLAVVSAVLFGAQLYRTEILSKRLPPAAALPVTAVAMLTVAMVASTAAVAQNSGALGAQLAALAAHAPHMTWADAGVAWGQVQSLQALPWGDLMFTGIFATLAVLLIELLALNTVSSTEAAIIYTAEPLWGALLAYCFLGERWGLLGWVGAALITSCSLATQLGGAEEAPTMPTDVDAK